MSGFFTQNDLLGIHRLDALLNGRHRRRGLDFDKARHQLVCLPVQFAQTPIKMLAAVLLPASPMLPQVLEHRLQRRKHRPGRLQRLHELAERTLDHIAANGLAAALAALGDAVVVRIDRIAPFAPASRQRLTTVAAGDESPKGKIRIEVLPCRDVSPFLHPLLNLLIAFEADERLMLALAQRYIPSLAFDVTSVGHARQNPLDILIAHFAPVVPRKLRVLLEETFHLRLQLQPARGIPLQACGDNARQRLVANDDLAAPGRVLDPLVTNRRLGVDVVAVEQSSAAAMLRDLADLLTLMLAHRRQQIFDKLRIRVFAEFDTR
ncbi:MAG: hypothetical protein VX836_19760 [Pseudomonadota bacterium]|nr:hypothetical protein [Pseudomonadota bacterium]